MHKEQMGWLWEERSLGPSHLAARSTETMLVAEVETLQEELHRLQEAVAAAQPFVSANLIKLGVTMALLQYKDAIARVDQGLRQDSLSQEEAHGQKSKPAQIYAAHITDLVCQQVERPILGLQDAQHYYLVQFRMAEWQYFRTDCSFRHGQLDLATVYVWSVVDSLEKVAQGRVLDAATHRCVYAYP